MRTDQLFFQLPGLPPETDPARNLWVTQFLGVITVQHWVDLLLWERVLNAFPDLKHVVELGSLRGGLSLFLYLQCIQRGMGFDTFDLAAPECLKTEVAKRLGMAEHCHTGDLWGKGIFEKFETILSPQNHPLLFFCDNGDKPREIQHFVPRLSPGDVVGVHDWGVEFSEKDLESISHLVKPILESDHAAIRGHTKFWVRI